MYPRHPGSDMQLHGQSARKMWLGAELWMRSSRNAGDAHSRDGNVHRCRNELGAVLRDGNIHPGHGDLLTCSSDRRLRPDRVGPAASCPHLG